MKKIIKEWISKAEGDYASALREYRARKNPNYDSACFHAQQCIEKYLKGTLQKHNTPFGKTHDLSVLLKTCITKYPLWETWKNDLKTLSIFAVQFRYPGETAKKEDARKAVRIMKKYRTEIRQALHLD
ncbi:HEPN domain-containing protein [Verrucomicrobiota bacterium]